MVFGAVYAEKGIRVVLGDPCARRARRCRKAMPKGNSGRRCRKAENATDLSHDCENAFQFSKRTRMPKLVGDVHSGFELAFWFRFFRFFRFFSRFLRRFFEAHFEAHFETAIVQRRIKTQTGLLHAETPSTDFVYRLRVQTSFRDRISLRVR